MPVAKHMNIGGTEFVMKKEENKELDLFDEEEINLIDLDQEYEEGEEDIEDVGYNFDIDQESEDEGTLHDFDKEFNTEFLTKEKQEPEELSVKKKGKREKTDFLENGNFWSDKKKLKEFLEKNKIYCMYGGILAVLILLLIVVLVITSNKSAKKSGTEGKTATSDIITQTDSNGDPIENTLKENAYPEIKSLVEKYFEAISTCDLDKLKLLVDNTDGITKEDLEEEHEYIESYANIEIYTKDGPTEGTYVAFVYYENKILNIDTLAPSSCIMYIVSDKEKEGSYYIANNIKNGDIKAYIDHLKKDEDVVEFNNNVNKKLQEACSKDEDLKTFYDTINAVSETAEQSETE